MSTAIFPGTFNPFTIGHADMVSRGLKIFDHIIICVGVNISKLGDDAPAPSHFMDIMDLYSNEDRVTVVGWEGLTIDCARQYGADVLLRGVRSVKDFEYERDMADANRALCGMDTVVLLARPELAWVSSSVVRELQKFGRDVTDLLPRRTL